MLEQVLSLIKRKKCIIYPYDLLKKGFEKKDYIVQLHYQRQKQIDKEEWYCLE